jgi:hypothetical protein
MENQRLYGKLAAWLGRTEYPSQAETHDKNVDSKKILDEERKEFERFLFPRLHGCQMFATDGREIGVLAADCFPRIGDEIWELDGS